MKKALLILVMVLLPLQSAIAAQRSFVHMIGNAGAGNAALVMAHVVAHEAHIAHHHDDDDDDDDDAPQAVPHVDDSSKSIQHLNDVEHGGTLNLLLPMPIQWVASALPTAPPALTSVSFTNRTTLPPLRPPCVPA